MEDIIKIEIESPAWKYLQRLFLSGIRDINISRVDEGLVKIKCGGAMWSPPISTQYYSINQYQERKATRQASEISVK